MYLCKLELQGFRGIKKGVIIFPEHCVLIGRNNSGKTTIAEAISLLLGRDRLVRNISDYDFFGGNPLPNTRFLIIGTLTGFPSNDPDKFPTWFNPEKGGTHCWWLPNTNEVVFGDPPNGAKLAVQIALSGKYDEDLCEYETVRFFYDGNNDPFVESYFTVPNECLKELGVFFLPAERNSEKILTFGSSTFLKLIKENEAIPAKEINKLKDNLKKLESKLEQSERFKKIISRAENELSGFLSDMIDFALIYRVSNLDTESVMRSLVPHIQNNEFTIPLNRQGAGVNSLQLLLLLLEFGKYRIENSKNFILIAEEPELHLHPGAQRRLSQRIRGSSIQSICTSHSPIIAGYHLPNEILFIRNDKGTLHAEPLLNKPLTVSDKNSFQKLFVSRRRELCQALMSKYVLLPEGIGDADLLNLLILIYETQQSGMGSDENNNGLPSADVSGIGIVPTQDASTVFTYLEIRRLRPDVIPFVDGDASGLSYVEKLVSNGLPPEKIICLENGWNRESLITWLISPLIKDDPATLHLLFNDTTITDEAALNNQLTKQKQNNALLENLVWEIRKSAPCFARCKKFLEGLGKIVSGEDNLLVGWQIEDKYKHTKLYSPNFVNP